MAAFYTVKVPCAILAATFQCFTQFALNTTASIFAAPPG